MNKNSNNYWATLIARIRMTQHWSQVQFAFEVESDQATVSRWEQGVAVPSQRKQRQIEVIAERIKLPSLQGIADVVNNSPFPMLLTDQEHHVLAASLSSGFEVGLGVVEQTPLQEREHFLGFADRVTKSGFWNQAGGRYDYSFYTDNVIHSAVVTPVIVRGKVYAVVQLNLGPAEKN